MPSLRTKVPGFPRYAAQMSLNGAATRASRIAAWQNSGVAAIPVSGFPQADWATSAYGMPGSPASQTNAYTIIERGHSMRQDGVIASINVYFYYLHATGDRVCAFRVFRYSLDTSLYTCVASCNFTPVGSGTVSNVQTFAIDPPISVRLGDMPALYLPPKMAIWPSLDASGKIAPIPAVAVGNIDVGASDAFALNLHDISTGAPNPPYSYFACFQAMSDATTRPYALFLGDSLLSDGNGPYPATGARWASGEGSVAYIHTPGGSLLDNGTYGPGDINCSVAYRLSTRMPVNFRYQDFSKGGSTWANLVALSARGIVVDPKIVWLHCGYNDVATGRTWAQISANLDTIRATIGAGRTVFLNEVMPSNAGLNDAQNAALQALNVSYATYAATYGWTLVPVYTEMGVAVGGKTYLDLNPAYSNGDSVHLNTTGVDKLAEIMGRYAK